MKTYDMIPLTIFKYFIKQNKKLKIACKSATAVKCTLPLRDYECSAVFG